MTNWKITGFIATIIIILVPPLYLLKEKYTVKSVHIEPTAAFVGAEKCIECHKNEYDRWRNSHHDKAMSVATEESVLGDFNGTTFEHFGVVSRFRTHARLTSMKFPAKSISPHFSPRASPNRIPVRARVRVSG